MAGAATACADADQQADTLPPVEDTAPSEDERILNDAGTMSDGSPISPHTTETVATSIEMVSEGAIGGMSIDADGNVYNTNFSTTVWKTAPDGTTTVLSDEFTQASGNFALDDGSMLQADFEENIIYRIAPDGTRSVFAEGGLDGPVGIARRPQGDFVVASYRGRYLARVPADGGEAEVALRYEKMTRPNGVTIDPDGNIYVADLVSGIVFKWTPAGDIIELAKLPG
jgi:sugar lactone lactonase YvrE